MPLVKIAPSILSADFACLGQEVRDITKAGADYIHVDVMDGRFVPNITIGPPVIRAIRDCSDVPFDVHLMITPADPHIKSFCEAGANIVTVHPEGCRDLKKTIKTIHAHGCKAGVSLNPETSLDKLSPVLDDIDLVLIMTVHPGFGGQSFMKDMLPKIAAARKEIDARTKPILLEVDGGINAHTAPEAINAGADILVAGTAAFQGDCKKYSANLATLRAPPF